MPLSPIEQNGSVRLKVKAVPGSSRDRVMGVLGDALKIAVSAPPQKGAANAAIIKLLADKLGMHPSKIEIVRGHTSPRKEVLVRGITAHQLVSCLGL